MTRQTTLLASPQACCVGLCVAIALGLLEALPVSAQEATSGALAKELVTLMRERKLDAFAVQDPATPGYFVAVRPYPDVQLLIVGAQSSSVAYMQYQLDRQDYGEAYSALNASAVPESKVFVQDMGCDGLQKAGDHVDVLYEKAAAQVLFDGTGKASGLSKSEYAEKAAVTEAQYAKMLGLLINGLRNSSQITTVAK